MVDGRWNGSINIFPYGDMISFSVEGMMGYTGGISKQSGEDVLEGSLETSSLDNAKNLFGELADNIAGKALKVYDVYQATKKFVELDNIRTIDNISFDLMNISGIATTSKCQKVLEENFTKTAAFIAKYSGYFIDEFKYGIYSKNTPYLIDRDLASAKNTKALDKKINTYLSQYKWALKKMAENAMYTGIFPDQVDDMVFKFKLWLQGSTDRRKAMVSEYKTFIDK